MYGLQEWQKKGSVMFCFQKKGSIMAEELIR